MGILSGLPFFIHSVFPLYSISFCSNYSVGGANRKSTNCVIISNNARHENIIDSRVGLHVNWTSVNEKSTV